METEIEKNNKKHIVNNTPLLVTLFLLFCSGVGNAALGYKCSNLSKSLGQHIQQLELARTRTDIYATEANRAAETNRELRATIGKAAETNRELGECLSRSTNTLSELRSQLTEVRRRYQEMEVLLYNAGDIYNNSNSSIISDRKTE